MVTLEIDDETFTVLSTQAAAHGLSVADWLKTSIADTSADVSHRVEMHVKERLERFDQMTRTLEQMKIGSGGLLDDSRETIYGERGI